MTRLRHASDTQTGNITAKSRWAFPMTVLTPSRGVCSAIVLLLVTSTSALAVDPACTPLLGAMQALRSKPFHLFMATENKYSSPAFARAAASIDLAGVKKSEEIWTGTDIYVLSANRWLDMHTNLAAMRQDNDPDTKKARDAERCNILPDEIVDGQPTAVVQTHNPELGTDGKFWISKTSHLPVRSETTTDTGPMKSFMSGRYTYDHVQAPAHAVSLSDVNRERH